MHRSSRRSWLGSVLVAMLLQVSVHPQHRCALEERGLGELCSAGTWLASCALTDGASAHGIAL